MSNNFNDPFADNLVGLWDFLNSGPTEDTGLADGVAQNGHLEGHASVSGERLHTDGDCDWFDVNGGNDHAFDLAEGTVAVKFTQDAHVGTSDDTIVNRGEYADRGDEGYFEIRVGLHGTVELMHCANGADVNLSTSNGFFSPGDTVKVTYSWSETDGGTFLVENQTTGNTESIDVTTTGLTMDVGDNDDESWTFGARENDDGHYNHFFDGKIDYVAVYNKDIINNGGDGIVSGDETANDIDLGYTGDPEGDMIDAGDALLAGEAPDDDIVDAGAGNDTVEAGQGDDDVYAGSGDDSVLGEGGNDLIFGDSNLAGGPVEESTVRESFEWDLAPNASGFTQNTGNVDVTFSTINLTGAAVSSLDTDAQNVSGIVGDGNPIDDNSSLGNILNGHGNDADYKFDFSEPVENVSFRINDIDGDGVVRVLAYNEAGDRIEVNLTGGSHLTVTDEDGIPGAEKADSNGGYLPDTSDEYSALVDIPGPVAKIVIKHDQDGSNNSGINITDIYYDVTVGDTGADGNDTLLGGDGEDTIFGEGSDDSIVGGADSDSLVGGSGDDTIDAVSGGGSATGPNLIVNGSFEDTTGMTPTGYGFVDTGAIPAWTTADPNAEIDIHNDGRGGIDPTDGNNWLDLDASPGNIRVGQDVAGVTAGESYTLTFDAGDKADEPSSGPGENLINVYWGGELIDTVDPAQGQMDSYQFTVVGGAGDGSNRLEFEGTGNEDNFGASVDNVQLFLLDGDGTGGADMIEGGDDADLIFAGAGDVVDGGAGGFNADPALDNDQDVLDLTGQGPFFLDNVTPDSNGNGINGTVVFVDGALNPTGETIEFTEIETVIGDEVNRPPEAGDDTGSGDEDTLITGNVLGNDTDPDSGAVLEVIGNTDPANGTVTVNHDGSYEYTPDANFNGTDSFTYTVTDNQGGTDTATVTITVDAVNDDPVANSDTANTDFGTAVAITVLPNDTDVDGDTPSVLDATDGANGTTAVNGDGTISYTPNDDFEGTDTFTYTITDGNGGTDTATVTVTVAPDPRDGIVEGTDIGELIDESYEGDPEGDKIDNGDALLPGEGPEDDIVLAGGGNDTIVSGLGDDDVDAGTGNDDVTTGAGSDSVLGGDGNDTIDTGSGNNVLDYETFVGIPFETGDDQLDDKDTVIGGAGDDSISTGDDADFITGDLGNDTIDGGIDDDTISGGLGDDSIDGGLGSDSIDGGQGNDTIIAGIDAFSDYVGDDPNLPDPFLIDPATGLPALSDPNEEDGKDTVNGGEGDDLIFTGDDDDQITGGTGNDTINAGIDDDSVQGNDGNDSITGSHGSDTIDGGDGDDTIWGGFGNDPLPGTLGEEPDATDPVPENGRDVIDGGDGNDFLYGEDDDDTITGGTGNDFIDGGVDDDSLRGQQGDDTILGQDGDDTIGGGAGSDIIDGGDGDDFVEGGADVDVILGEAGNVTLFGNADTDLILGGDDDDQIFGGDGVDILDGEAGNDTVDGGAGSDLILGEGGEDELIGAGGEDIILGGTGNDTIYGDGTTGEGNTATGGADILFGQEGDDIIIGGTGDDLIDGAEGADSMSGGDDQDTFIEVGPGDVIDGGEGGVDFDTIVLSGPALIDYDPGNPENGTITFIDLTTQSPIGTATFTNIENVTFVQPDANPPEAENDDNTDPGTDPIDVTIDFDAPEDLRSPPPPAGAPEGHVDGTDSADTMLPGYVDVDGDIMDGGDAILTGEVGDDDIVRAYGGDDFVDAGLGDDEVFAGDGDDTVFGNAGDDVLRGEDGDDILEGNAGDDRLRGDDGNDLVLGSVGNDSLEGNDGDDTLRGGDDEDLMVGGAGNDRLDGAVDAATPGDDGSNDLALGGADEDTFVNFGPGDIVDGGSTGVDNDTLDLTGTAPTGGSLVIDITGPDSNGNGSDGTVTYFDDTGTEVGVLRFSEIENIIPCFTPGTVIATPKGERLVEELREGDRIITRDNGLQEIRWVGRRDLSGQELAQAPHLKPVLIRAGSLGHGLPERDMMVSPQHRLLINNDRTALYFEEREVLAAAKHLTGMEGVDSVEASSVSYIHFMFDQHEVVLSNGSWTESFQPGEQVLDGMGNAQRNEIFELFPELAEKEGLNAYQAARRSLKKHEARLLVK